MFKTALLFCVVALMLGINAPQPVSDTWGNAPKFSYTSYSDDKTVQLDDFYGQPIVATFWAVW